MSEIKNRAIYLAGERRKVGTPNITVLLENSTGILRCYGASVPTDADVGYAPGCIFHLSSGGSAGGTVYINEGTKASADFNAVVGGGGGGGAALTFETVYDNGRTVNVDTGAFVYNDATTGAANVLEFNKTGAGSGNIIDMDFSAAFTGNAINLDMGSALAANGLVVDSEGNARTGADILITDDSTGAHSVMDINKSGAGATVGFDYQESYNGSSASFAMKVTLDANDGIDTTALQIVRNAGIRTAPAIDINEASTGSANVIDIDVSGVYTGDIIDIVTSAAATGNAIHVDLDSAVAMTALRVEGSGVRTQPYLELISDSTGSAVYFDINIDGAGSGNVIDITTSTTFTGSLINLDLTSATGGVALTINGANAARTANLVAVTNDGSGNTDVMEIADSNTGSGHVFDINVSGIGSGNVIDITYSAADTGDALKVVMADNVAGGALVITGAGARTDNLIEVTTSETGSVDGIMRMDATGVFTGHVMLLKSSAAATTGGLLHLDLDAGVAYKGITVDTAGARTAAVMLFTLDHTYGSAGGATLFDINIAGLTGASAGPLIDIDISSGVFTGNILDFATDQASTGTILEINMTNAVAAKLENYTLAGTRTVNANTVTSSAAGAVDIWQIDDSGTSSGHVWDVNISGNSTGNVLDIVYSSSAVQGDAIHVDMGTNLAGNAIQIDAAGARTAPLINIQNTGTDGGTDDHVILINQTGLLDSDLVHLTFATAASLGEALSIEMGTNVAGRAILITSAATGVTGEGSALDVTHTGDLVAGANLIDIISTGSPSSTSHTVSIQQTTGAGTAGAYALYINATGANVEALKVDAGKVVFDETLEVTGACTFSSTISFKDLTEVVTGTNVITAAESGSVFFLDSATEFVSTLPAVAAGLHFTFIVKTAPSGASYTVVTDSSANIIKGKSFPADGAAGDTGTADDTVSFVDGQSVAGDRVEFYSDGTSWFAYAFPSVAAGITFTQAS